MTSVIHGLSWLFIQTYRYTGPVFELGPFGTGVWVSSSGRVLKAQLARFPLKIVRMRRNMSRK